MISLDIVTPVRRLVEGAKAAHVILPGGKGQLEILPGHRDLLTTLGTGVLAYKSESGQEKYFAISYGFAEIKKDRVTVLAETCEPAQEIDLKRAQEAQKKAEQTLSSGLGEESEFKKQQLKLERALIRQQVAGKSNG